MRAPGGTSLELIADAAGAAATEIFDLNQHYVRKVTPPGRAADVRIPHGRSAIFASNFARVASVKRAATFVSLR